MIISIRKRIIAVFIAATAVLWCVAGTILFASAEETNGTTGSLTLWCVKDTDVVDGMEWHLYRVGYRVNDDYVFEGDFSSYRPTLGDKTKPMLEWDAETVEAVGDTLKKFTIVDNLTPRANGTTNSQGAVTFSDLENGLYLVWGEVLYKGDTTYIPSAIFFEVNGEEASFLNAYPKIVLKTLSDTNVQYSVKKIWKNDENQSWNRATSIVVERYRDNEYYDEVTLSEENDWSFGWNDSENHIWFVHEKVIPEGYTISYKDNHTQYLIINTYEGDTIDTGTITTTTSNISTNQITTGKSTTTQTTGTTTITSKDKVPQTGQLWWPVPGLAGGGIALLCLGTALLKKDDDE